MAVRAVLTSAKTVIGRGIRAVERSRWTTSAIVQLNAHTSRSWGLPILMFAPTSRCNSRCVSCDFWRTDGAKDLRRDEVAALARELPRLRTKLVVFTGGEPLVRDDVFELADLFRAQGVTLHLLTSGLALERHAAAIVERFAAVTVSLDGHTSELYRSIRGVDGLEAVARGVRRLKQLRPTLSVRARSTLQGRNFRRLPELIDKAGSMGLDQISFLGADVTSESFGRGSPAVPSNPHGLLLTPAEVLEFERVVEKTIVSHAKEFASGRVAENSDKLRRLPRYYAAQQGQGPFPAVQCNAPWVSAVVESDGTVRPCFFQPAIGNVRENSLRSIVTDDLVRFRKSLDVGEDRTCQRCVCSLRFGVRSRVE